VKATFTAAQYRNSTLGRYTEHSGRITQSSSQPLAAESTPFILLVVGINPHPAGRDVLLLLKATAPYYNLVTDENVIININDVEINSNADDEVKRLGNPVNASTGLKYSTRRPILNLYESGKNLAHGASRVELATIRKIYRRLSRHARQVLICRTYWNKLRR
jgi:hypothetical protein